MFGRESWMRGLVLVLTVVAMAVPAWSQQFSLPMAVGEAFQPDYLRRDLATIAEVLALDADQRAVTETLFADYDAEFRKNADAARKEMQLLVPLAAIDEEARAAQEEQIRLRVAELMEQVQKTRTDAPPGEEGEAARQEIQKRAAEIRQEIAALNAAPVSGEQLQKALAQSEGVLAAWQAQKDQMRREFETGVQAILTEEQGQRWPTLERRLRRDKTLARGRLSGESANILLLASQLKMGEDVRAAIAHDLVEFEIRLDAALKAREEQLKKANLELLNATHSRDRAKAESVAARLVAARVTVRNVNDEAAKLIAAKLPPEASKEFQSAFRGRAYPRVFRTTSTQRLLNAAKEMPGLEPAMVEAVMALQKVYLAELEPSNERLLAAVRAAEPVDMEETLVRTAVGGEEDVEPSVARMEAEFDQRLLLGDRVETQLETLLGPENWEKLPHRPSSDGEAGTS